MRELSSTFNADPRAITEVLEGDPTVTLHGFGDTHLEADHWSKPTLTHVSAHTPRSGLVRAIKRKTLQIRLAWGAALLTFSASAFLLGFAIGRTP